MYYRFKRSFSRTTFSSVLLEYFKIVESNRFQIVASRDLNLSIINYHFKKRNRLVLVQSRQRLKRETTANDERTIRASRRLIALNWFGRCSSSVRDEIKISDACRKAITDFSCDPQLTGLMRER